MKFECPVCHGTLIHTRIDDGILKRRILPDGSVEELCNDSDGSDNVQCETNHTHAIPRELVDAVLEIM